MIHHVAQLIQATSSLQQMQSATAGEYSSTQCCKFPIQKISSQKLQLKTSSFDCCFCGIAHFHVLLGAEGSWAGASIRSIVSGGLVSHRPIRLAGIIVNVHMYVSDRPVLMHVDADNNAN